MLLADRGYDADWIRELAIKKVAISSYWIPATSFITTH
jgi:hypothetical protein